MAPLSAAFFRRRAAAVAILITATTTLALALTHNQLKPFAGPNGHPWQFNQARAVVLNWQPAAAVALIRLNAFVAPDSCAGAVLGGDEPSYLLYGSRLSRPVTFLPRDSASQAAVRAGLPYVVIGNGEVSRAAAGFAAKGWKVRPLFVAKHYTYWLLAISPTGGGGRCYSKTAAGQAATPGA